MYKYSYAFLPVWILKATVLIFICIYTSNVGFAQRCPVPELLEERERQNAGFSSDQFEKWLQEKIQIRKANRPDHLQSFGRQQIIQIPVVFHIIHKGEPLGTGTNLSKERIDQQLATLNKDFKRLNSDTTQTLAEFKPLAANTEIEFVYAKQNPEGLETTGIERVYGNQNTYSYSERSILSSQSYWPAEEFLNIWVADLAGSSLGWAEFPVSNLPGLEEASNNRLIDGVTIDYEYFGDNPLSPSFESKGRTATHEMGHFFGLRHIWGDGDCSVDDYCEDTPESDSNSSGCDISKTTCGSLDMVQNFMDYTDDECMNLFTHDQKERIRTIIENSPRRASLTISKALNPPIVYDYDLALIPLNNTFNSNCNNEFTPVIEVKNIGSLAAENYEVQLYINNSLEETILQTVKLNPGKSIEIKFSPLIFNIYGDYEISYEVKMDAGKTDGRVSNNKLQEHVQTLHQKPLPYQIVFEDGFSDWQIRNIDGEEGWMGLNGHAGIPFYNNQQNIGQKEELISPIFDLTQIERPEISFVFSQSADTLPHAFNIYASYDCGETFSDLVYSPPSNQLITAYAIDSAFQPTFRLDWDTVKVDINHLQNKSSVSFNIVVENRNANNFYINNFAIQSSETPIKEITPIKWNNTNPLYCDAAIQSELEIENTGISVVNSFNLQITNDNSTVYSATVNETLTVGERKTISIPDLKPEKLAGEYKITLSVESEEQKIEQSINLPFKYDCVQELPPLRLTLKEDNINNWFTFNPDNNITWTHDEVLNLINSGSSKISKNDQEDWLVTPLMDVSKVKYLGLIFDVSYQKPYVQSEAFKIYITGDDGTTFNTLIYERGGDSLATSFGNNESDKKVWRNEFLDLSPFVYRDKIRLAFKASHDNGQNIYLKNISFFIGQSPPPAYPLSREQFVIYPNPASDVINLHLNLNNATEGYFQITDLTGKVIVKFDEPKLLNQYITFDISTLADGMYLLHLRTDNLNKSERFIVGSKRKN